MSRDTRSRRTILKGAASTVALASGAGTVLGESSANASERSPMEAPMAVQWEKRYGSEDREYVLRGEGGQSALEMEDGGYAIGTGGRAVSEEGAGPERQFVLLRTDDTGEVQWMQFVDDGVDGTSQDCRDMGRSVDGGFVFVGEARQSHHVDGDPFEGRVAGEVVATDAKGTVRWTRVFDEPQKEPNPDAEIAEKRYETTLACVEQTADGGYFVGGQDSGWEWVAKLAADGTVQWHYHADHDDGYANFATVQALAPTADGGVVALTTTSAVKLGADGSEQWATVLLDRTELVTATDVVRTTDGGFAVTGDVNGGKEENDSNDFYLVRMGADGSVRWAKYYDGPNGSDVSYRVIQTEDGGFLMSGIIDAADTGSQQFGIMNTDPDGTKQWHKVLTELEASPTAQSDLIPTSDGGYLLVSGLYDDRTNDSEKNGSDLYTVKVSPESTCDYSGAVDVADADDDCRITTVELRTVIRRWVDGEVTTTELREVISAWVVG